MTNKKTQRACYNKGHARGLEGDSQDQASTLYIYIYINE